jgi:hypothetical protein
MNQTKYRRILSIIGYMALYHNKMLSYSEAENISDIIILNKKYIRIMTDHANGKIDCKEMDRLTVLLENKISNLLPMGYDFIPEFDGWQVRIYRQVGDSKSDVSTLLYL